MKKLKLLAAAAVVTALFAAAAPAEARHVKPQPETTMQTEYGFQKSMKGAKIVKAKKKMKRKMARKHNRQGNYPNDCIKPPCGLNYEKVN